MIISSISGSFQYSPEYSQLDVWSGDRPMMTTPCEKLTCTSQLENSVLVDNIAMYKKIDIDIFGQCSRFRK